MHINKSKWLSYTLIIGAIPIATRFFVWSISKSELPAIFSPSDFIAYGLMLHIANINELEHQKRIDPSWKTIQNGASILFITIYTILYSSTLWGEMQPNQISQDAILLLSIFLVLTSFLLSASIFHRLYYIATQRTP